MKLILSYLKRHIVIFLISTAFLTLEAVADLMQPTYMSYIVDEGVANADVSRILMYGGIMLGIALFGAFCAVMRNHFASRTSQTIGKEIRHDIYKNVQSLSLENIDRLQPASIITRITNDVTQIQDFINSIMRIMIKAPITGIGAVILIIIQTPKQAPIMIVIILIATLLIVANIFVGYPRFGKVQKKLDKLNGVSREFLSSVRVVKAFRAEDKETEKFKDASDNLAAANTSALRAMAMFAPLINLTVNFGIVLLLFISKNQNASDIGRLMASVNYMGQVLFALNFISNVINNAVRALASSERIKEVLDEKPAQKKADNPKRPDIKGTIEFKDVSFAYAGASRDALSHITFTASPGETIGIIGPTGSGKSSLVNLIPRFYDASGGEILVDGVNVNEIDEEYLRSRVALVAQKALLFSGTIMENLSWGLDKKEMKAAVKADGKAGDNSLTGSQITEEDKQRIYKAAGIACAADFIEKTKDGYDTLLGQGGVNLSGGQKQRLSLARALIRDPGILILDDCTSALDANTESTVLKGLGEMEKKATVLLISQRISTVMRADRILCLNNGEVQGFGTHSELLANCQTYREIYESQIGKIA
ncbi:MAG: ABC transporter ATP-binding protein [Lachnospiraceae bacterium]|nr:ABC transporter ATP-binding protein [Lachnospiraceae bacterium]